MAFNVNYSFNNGTVTGTATDYATLYNAIHADDYTQITLSGTIEGNIGYIEDEDEPWTEPLQYGLFYNCTDLTSINLSDLDTSGVTSMSNMFNNCSLLTSLDVSNLDTSSVTNMLGMFSNCTNLTSVDVSNLNTSNVTTMYGMFVKCLLLTNIDISNFDTSKVTDMGYMFAYNNSLQHIYVGDNWDVSSITSSDNMFYDCSSLPNYNSSYEDKTKAFVGEGGYLEYKAVEPTNKFINIDKFINNTSAVYTMYEQSKKLL